MAKITAADILEEVEVDLWGTDFRLREVTRAVQDRLAKAQDAIESADEGDVDAQAVAIFEALDVLLEPVGDADGKKVHAKTILTKLWKDDELGADRLAAIWAHIENEADKRGRPTATSSTSQNGR